MTPFTSVRSVSFRHGVPLRAIPKFKVRDYKIRIRGKDAGMHRVMALARGSVLPEREILARSAAELAEFAGVRLRSVETKPARRAASPRVDRLFF